MILEKFRRSDIVIICGLPGSGKDHFAKKYFAKSGKKRVSRNDIRKNLYEMTSFGDTWDQTKFDLIDESLVKHIERKIIEHLLQNGNSVIINNRSVSADSRAEYVTLAIRMKKTISAIFINTDVKTCLLNNRMRETATVPDSVIGNFAARIEYPELSERFKEVLVIENYDKTVD